MKTSFSIALLASLLLANTAVHGQTTCNSTADCEAGAEYCSDGACAPIGFCQTEVDCYNEQNDFSSDDCSGYLECNANQCSKTCNGAACKPGSSLLDLFCPSVMCDIQNCEGAVSCVNNNCGECNIFYFDAKGSRICDNDDSLSSGPGVAEPVPCSSNSDCHVNIDDEDKIDSITNIMQLDTRAPAAQPYCAAGFCAAPGTCSTDEDCVNPSNDYGIIECVGPIVCQEGQCTRDCDTGSMCKEGATPVNCLVDPCTVTGCPESTGCVSDYCGGGCDAIHFDVAGNVLEECVKEPFTLPESCTQDKDCNDDTSGAVPTHYCSAGSCEAMGFCTDTTDCLNPSNEVNFVACTGYHQCTNGECGHVCSNEEHCCFVAAKCTAEELEACPDAVTCVKDNCNDSGDHCGAGTGSFYFDISGNSICASSPSAVPTENKATATGPGDEEELADGAMAVGSTFSLLVIVASIYML
ncbi:unnamed protein product [Cylindrotheca closterium]|uniref:Uncharacterized protein n=1 Tax=Cylindrotheca closterium TaxID=2856 RepID=A0AAD2G3V0_9STRA|nr:unnamed protein product [Cylindrotheca closterium]